MAPDLLRTRLARELGPINAALGEALQELPAPARPVAAHIIEAGGKRLRPFLTVVCARLLGSFSDRVYRLAATMELLHAATLLHDDILDCAPSRRGHPSAHIVFGQTGAILAGDAMLALGNAIIAQFNMPELSASYSQATMQTAAGEILEMSSLRQPQLAHDAYMEIARGKTGCLIGQACALGAIFAQAPPDAVQACVDFGMNIGIAFQLVDDALDFEPESQTGKPSGGDLREGKMTPPLRLYRASLNDGDRNAFDQAFGSGAFAPDQIEKIILAARPFARQSLAMADDCLQRARLALEGLPRGEEYGVLLAVADYIRSRSS